ncbi:Lrp/AsnC ligand binding domain-containing protein [Acidobacteria bacterium AH-259-O06]|nr:Lrp/AsnC ligand binding domain-containing protein [Acidobacteria bacterium AH-259-G07]MDA2929483.1 Lrp/AsnC ligand binding domain-containing protein [Acidobacteria bacterium AH-259-O06]
MKAYVLVNVRAGKARHVVDKVRQIEGVKSANACWGRPDVFTLVDVPSEEVLADTVLAEIQNIDGVESTDTHLVIE